MAVEIPKRRIVRVISPLPLLKKGERANVVLECKHFAKMTRSELHKSKTCYCFDCYYGKPADPMLVDD